jgi:hypothetical protein
MLQAARIVRRVEDICDEAISISPGEGHALAKPAIGTDLNGHRGHHIGDFGEKSSYVPKCAQSVFA